MEREISHWGGAGGEGTRYGQGEVEFPLVEGDT